MSMFRSSSSRHGRKSVIPLTLVAAICPVMLAVGASPALASTECPTCAPWWHLTSGSRPSYLHGGQAQDQVREIVAPTVEFEGHAEQTAFTLSVGDQSLGEFATEPLAAEFGLKALTAANVQSALETIYGTGNVTIEDKSVAGTVKLVVTTSAITPLNVEGLGLGEPTANVLSEGRPDGEIVLTAENVGDASANGAEVPISITDKLPAGLRAVGVSGWKAGPEGAVQVPVKLACSLGSLTCSWAGVVPPYEQIEERVAVVVEPGAASGEVNQSSVSGGNSPVASVGRPVTISGQGTPFGVEDYALTHEDEGGAPVTQAGAHPFQQTTTIVLNQGADTAPLNQKLDVQPAGSPKDTILKWPAGLIGNPSAIPRCTIAQFLTKINAEENECSPQSAVGVAVVTVNEPATIGAATFTLPLFNLEPANGEPARFGFNVLLGHAPVVIDTAVRTGGDYGVTVSSDNITQTAGFLSAKVTVWGVPGDARHDSARGWGCLYAAREANFPHAPCNALEQQHPPPFLTLPTSCPRTPLLSTIEADSWVAPGEFRSLVSDPMPALDGCDRLPFSAAIKLTPDGQAASTPTGLNMDVHVPQDVNENGAGLASSNLKDITVSFPEGVVLNPAAADGLQACSEEQIGYLPGQSTPPIDLHFTPAEPFCPEAAKVGTVKIKTPLLPNPLEGSLYLATPAPKEEAGMNPFGSLIATYIVARDPVSGVLVKLPGSVSLDQATGRITATFRNNPQVAFEDAEIHLFGGGRAPFATPARCGTYTTEAILTPWSGTSPIKSESSFTIISGPNGSPCPSPLPFAPSLTAGTTNNNAGSFSPLTTTIGREDGNQNINSVQLHMPPGLSGILAGVKLCPEAQANAGTCGPESLIGHTIVSVGLGGDPFSVTGGQVFLTEHYKGAPFGLSIVNPAVAGPFDLGKVTVRARIQVDPTTADLTITTDEIPHILKGIPLQIKHVNVTIDRPGFTFNPTNCSPLAVTGTIGSVEGASSPVSMPFQVTNCAALKFAPKFSVSTSGKTSKANGASLSVKLSEPNAPFGSQANIAKVKVNLPKQLPSRLTTLQKACTNAQFEANPAGCPVASKIGYAVVHTPLLPAPLTGPAIFVSHGEEAFPSLTMVLQGYGVTVDLVGTTFIGKRGITSTTFKAVPDVPFNTFQLTLPQGKYSALAANGSLCKSKLAMPTAFVGQNGLVIHRSTKITVTGCSKHKPKRKTKHKKMQRHGKK